MKRKERPILNDGRSPPCMRRNIVDLPTRSRARASFKGEDFSGGPQVADLDGLCRFAIHDVPSLVRRVSWGLLGVCRGSYGFHNAPLGRPLIWYRPGL